jgi:hypothetical protein
MKLKVIDITDNPDGSANVELDVDQEAMNMLIDEGAAVVDEEGSIDLDVDTLMQKGFESMVRKGMEVDKLIKRAESIRMTRALFCAAKGQMLAASRREMLEEEKY